MAAPPSTSRYSALLSELDAGQVDGPATRRLVASGDPAAMLLYAIEAAKRGSYPAAREAVQGALTVQPRSGLVHLVAGMVLYVTRDYGEALSCMQRSVELHTRYAKRAYSLAAARAARLGWAQDVRKTIEAAARLEPGYLRWHLEAARVHAQGRNWREALACQRRALELEDGSASLWMEGARLAAKAGEHDFAREAVDRSLELCRGETEYRLEAATNLVIVGDLERAAELLDLAHEGDPRDTRVLGERAEMALWRDDLDRAEELARLALEWNDDCVAARRVFGGIRVRRGEPARALELLDADADDYRTHVWWAEAAIELGRFGDAYGALTRASMSADGFAPVVWLLRLLATLREGDPAPRVTARRFGELRDLLCAVEPTAAQVMAEGRHDAVADLAARVLERLRGNRSTTPTMVDEDGTLRRLPPLEGVRHAARRALERIRTSAPEQALSALDEVARRHPDQSLAPCHKGELLLWLGRLEESQRELERALDIDPETRWAYIGLTGIDILRGDPERALETSARGVRMMRNTEGPAVYAYRGEAHRRAGHLDAALADLRRACELHPSRVGARVNLVLALIERDDEPSEELRREADVLCEQAPGLLSDAARELGVTLWTSPDRNPSPAELRPVLEHALALMRGNRSSSVCTYFTSGGHLRYVLDYPNRGRGPHDTDADDLMQARTMVMRAVGLTDGKPAAARASPGGSPTPEPEPEPVLREQDIETFLRRGYVRLRGCFTPELAREWRADANRRIRLAPSKYVKGYDTNDPARDLSGYDAEDPATWTWERIDLEGDRWVPISEIAPKAWAAMCDLLGGSHRIATTHVSDYFVINFRERADAFPMRPDDDWRIWHLDDPSSRARLDNYRNGLVCIWLFDDVLPDSGGTWIAPDSIGHVARMLREHPEGYDFVDRDSTAVVARRCEEFVELSGEVGDVYLLHPFMLHCASPNPSGRIRWMSNPVIHTNEPLVLRPAEGHDHCPVERAVLRALSEDRAVTGRSSSVPCSSA